MLPLSGEVLRRRDELVALRRALHRCPEPGFRERATAALIRDRLRRWGIEHRSVCGTGTVAWVRGTRPGPAILIRADLDGLPLEEKTRLPFASRNRGWMHACGHDGHVAMALAAARILRQERTSLRGCVKFVFQPAEEGPGGAGPMIRAGILRDPPVEAAFALHLWNDLPTGRAGADPGPVFAGADEFRMTVLGSGGHGAAPHQTRDPLAAAAHVMTACLALPGRRVDPVRGAVVTFGRIQGGTRQNIIPDEVVLEGTIRAFEEPVRRLLLREVPGAARGVASAFGARVRFEVYQGYPPTVNDPGLTARVREVLRGVLGEGGLVEGVRSMGAEDMALVMRRVPGCYFFLGSGGRRGPAPPHHSARFDFDEDALPLGVEIWIRLARAFLGGPGAPGRMG